MDELIKWLPQVGSLVALVLATVYSVRRIMQSDGEWKEVVAQKDADLDRKDAEIARLQAELNRRRR